MPPRRRSVAALLTLLALLALAACAAETASEGAVLRREGGTIRIALIPPDLTLSRISAGGTNQPVAAWTLQAERNLTLALMDTARARGLSLEPAAHDLWSDDRLRPARRLHRAIEAAIVAHRFGGRGERLPAKGNGLGWSLGRAALPLRARVQADYALFVTLSDSYASTGRQALGVASLLLFGLPIRGGEQIGLATLVDLRSGAVIWASRLDRPAGDLRDAAAARETAGALLRDLPL